jgi:hypothetical protein
MGFHDDVDTSGFVAIKEFIVNINNGTGVTGVSSEECY